jgi:hypothetical protein
VALELIDEFLGARNRISLVVLEAETDLGHGGFQSSFFQFLSNEERMRVVYLTAAAITGKWTAPKVL